jgi:hypothetical protein
MLVCVRCATRLTHPCVKRESGELRGARSALAYGILLRGETQTRSRDVSVTPLCWRCFSECGRPGCRSATDSSAGSGELSDSHELSMLHPAPLSVTPQAAQPKKRLEGWNGKRQQVCVRVCGAGRVPCGSTGGFIYSYFTSLSPYCGAAASVGIQAGGQRLSTSSCSRGYAPSNHTL